MPAASHAVLVLLFSLSFLAGFVDAIVGGGGLIQTPALLVLFPAVPVATLFGTNKLASIVGTGSAAVAYVRRVRLDWRVVAPAALSAMALAFLGARMAASVRPAVLRPIVLVVLALVAAYTFARKDFGSMHRAVVTGGRAVATATLVGATVGFYDGLFGPGAGSFLVFLFIGTLGFDFLHASAAAKITNTATNLAALAYFVPTGHVLYALAVPMAVCNAAGGVLGARLAIRRGTGFVRVLFLVVVSALMARLAWDLLRSR